MKQVLIIDKKKQYYRLLKRTFTIGLTFTNYYNTQKDYNKQYNLCFVVLYKDEDMNYLFNHNIQCENFVLLYDNKKSPFLFDIIMQNIILIDISTTKHEYLIKIKEILNTNKIKI